MVTVAFRLLVVVNGDDVEYRLMSHLLSHYDNRIRPSLNASHPLNVTFGLSLAQIIDVVSIDTHTHTHTQTHILRTRKSRNLAQYCIYSIESIV